MLCVPVYGPIPHFFGELATSHRVKSGREMPSACSLFSEWLWLFRGLGVSTQMFRMFVLFLWKMPLKFDQVSLYLNIDLGRMDIVTIFFVSLSTG